MSNMKLLVNLSAPGGPTTELVALDAIEIAQREADAIAAVAVEEARVPVVDLNERLAHLEDRVAAMESVRKAA